MSSQKITGTVRDLCLKANFDLRSDVLFCLKQAYKKEYNPRAKKSLAAIIENARLAKDQKLALCQDTGFPAVFVWLGQDVHIAGDLNAAINKGIAEGYKKGFLRNSIVRDPLKRACPGYAPAVIHIDVVRGDKIKLAVLPKGFGCENKTQLKMFNPTARWEEIAQFIVETVKDAGADACPPYVIGVGIGGTAEYAALLAKKALLRSTKTQEHKSTGLIRKLERRLLSAINKLGIGPMGLGGKATALAVHIETYPTHIAGLPVAVSLSCHALRSATAII